ncbi:hypothetical protein CSUI_011110, partial [Cystoisospora suis]
AMASRWCGYLATSLPSIARVRSTCDSVWLHAHPRCFASGPSPTEPTARPARSAPCSPGHPPGVP